MPLSRDVMDPPMPEWEQAPAKIILDPEKTAGETERMHRDHAIAILRGHEPELKAIGALSALVFGSTTVPAQQRRVHERMELLRSLASQPDKRRPVCSRCSQQDRSPRAETAGRRAPRLRARGLDYGRRGGGPPHPRTDVDRTRDDRCGAHRPSFRSRGLLQRSPSKRPKSRSLEHSSASCSIASAARYASDVRFPPAPNGASR